MSEYIGYKDPIGNGMFNMGLTDEEIVRCRDCKKTEIEDDEIRCKRFQHKFVDERGIPRLYRPLVEPDGYCAWGEKR